MQNVGFPESNRHNGYWIITHLGFKQLYELDIIYLDMTYSHFGFKVGWEALTICSRFDRMDLGVESSVESLANLGFMISRQHVAKAGFTQQKPHWFIDGQKETFNYPTLPNQGLRSLKSTAFAKKCGRYFFCFLDSMMQFRLMMSYMDVLKRALLSVASVLICQWCSMLLPCSWDMLMLLSDILRWSPTKTTSIAMFHRNLLFGFMWFISKVSFNKTMSCP